MLWKVSRRVLLWGAAALSMLLIAGAIGLHLPGLPVAGLVGTIIFAELGPWAIIAAAALTLFWFKRGRRSRNYSSGLLAAGCLVAALSLSWNVARFVLDLRGQGIAVQPMRALVPGVTRANDVAIRIVPYGSTEKPLHLVLYRRPVPSNGPLPILVYVHGGGWISGTPTQRGDDIAWFTGMGMIGISLDYTLSDPHRHLWNMTEGEIGCGLAWVARNAATLGGDPRKIVVFGDSAGGNLAINAAYKSATGRLTSSCGGVPPHVRAVIVTYPVVDPASFHRNPDLLLGGVSRLMTDRYVGGSPDAFPRRYAAIASVGTISREAPPTLVFVPENDHLVPPGPATTFVQRAVASGVAVRQINVPDADHAFDAGSVGSFGNQVFRNGSRTFLDRIGVLSNAGSKRSTFESGIVNR